jgi:hypothetical protein
MVSELAESSGVERSSLSGQLWTLHGYRLVKTG